MDLGQFLRDLIVLFWQAGDLMEVVDDAVE